MDVYRINTEVGLSFSKELGTNNSVPRPILSNNLLYNLYTFL